MPPKKKQRTGENSAAPAQDSAPEASNAHKEPDNASDKDSDGQKDHDLKSIPDHEYICIHRPYFDFKMANGEAGSDPDDDSDNSDEDGLYSRYEKQFEETRKKGIVNQPAMDHPEWKWAMLGSGWKTFCEYRRRANYCEPDNFGMYIYNDFQNYGFQELVENMIVTFDIAFKKKDAGRVKEMWAVLSGLGLWLNEVNQGPFFSTDDGVKTSALVGLVGCALLTALAAIEKAKQLKEDSEFVDLAIVITEFISWSNEAIGMGIEDDDLEWRSSAAAYFKSAKLAADKGIAKSADLLKSIDGTEDEEDDDKEGVSKKGKDPWGWAKTLKEFKAKYGPKIGGTKYDITKMSRAERARYAFDKVDPLKDISDKDLKEGNLDLV